MVVDANTIGAAAALVTAIGGLLKQMRDRRKDRRSARSETVAVAKAAAAGPKHVAEVATALENTGQFQKLELPNDRGPELRGPS